MRRGAGRSRPVRVTRRLARGTGLQGRFGRL